MDIDTMSIDELRELEEKVSSLLSDRHIDITHEVTEKLKVGDVVTLESGWADLEFDKGIVSNLYHNKIGVDGSRDSIFYYSKVIRIVRDTELIFDRDTVRSIGKRD